MILEKHILGKAASPEFTEVDPHCEWVRVREWNTLVVYLPEFSKEELKVHADTSGKLKISGQRALDGSKWCRFLKTFQIPRECNIRMIQANFDEGKLYVVLPKADAAGYDGNRLDQGIGHVKIFLGVAVEAFRKHWKLITAVAAMTAVAVAIGSYAAYELSK